MFTIFKNIYTDVVEKLIKAAEYNALGVFAFILCTLSLIVGVIVVGALITIYTSFIVLMLYVPVAVFIVGLYAAVVNDL